MTDFLLDLQIFALPMALALILVSGIKRFRVTRNKGMAMFSLGSGILLLSQIIVIGAYRIFPVVIGADGGLVSQSTRDQLFWLSVGLNIVGFTLAPIGFALYSFGHAGPANDA